MAFSFNDVNKRGTYTWIKCNDDARANYFRNMFTSKYGGKFVRTSNIWEWVPLENQIIILEPSVSQPANKEEKQETKEKSWIFSDENNKKYVTKNLQEFCKQNNLSRSSLYEVISGRRKSHKGFKIDKIIE
jgi:hypothetical protein